MKAIVCRTYGPPEVLQIADVPKPRPRENEILIRVRAAEVTKADCELRSFDFAVKWFALPLRLALGVLRPRKPILGGYFAGEVVETGAKVTKFSAGDEIFGSCGFRFGAYGEYVCLPENSTLALKPENQSFAEAAALPMGGLNGLHFMRLANIKPGEAVLINGAGGSIGTFALQIAKSMGADVTAVDSAHKAAMLRKIGADHVIDYTHEDFTRLGKTYDVVFDMVASSDFGASVRTLNPGGRYLMGNPRLMDMVRSVLTNRFSDKSANFAFAAESTEELQTLRSMTEQREIRSLIDRVYPMAAAAAAHTRVETEQRCGIVVLALV